MRVTSLLGVTGLILIACSTGITRDSSARPVANPVTPHVSSVSSVPSPTAKRASAPTISATQGTIPSPTRQSTATRTAIRAFPTVADDGTPFMCRVTGANASTPPGEHPYAIQHGNGALWTELSPSGIVLMTPDSVRSDGSLSMKFPWWRSHQFQDSKLTIQGRRLDAPAPPLRSEISSGSPLSGVGGFAASSIIFPTEGCWEVTGRAGKASLTFVTLVVTSPVPVEYPPGAYGKAPAPPHKP